MTKATAAKTAVGSAKQVSAKPKPAVEKKSAAIKPKASAAKPLPAAKPGVTPAVAKPKAAAPASSVKPAPNSAAKAAPAPKDKIKKPKLVRDSFTMPEAEYQVLGDVKKACLKAGVAVKKSELLRVGVALIKTLDTAKLKAALAALPALKAGRPKNEK